MMKDLLVITASVIFGFPLLIACMSFVCWQNGFRILGKGYIIRMTIFLVVFAWVIYFIPRGAA